jgi:hypothetical protein
MDPIQTLFKRQLRKPLRRILFVGPNFGGKFEFNVSSPT